MSALTPPAPVGDSHQQAHLSAAASHSATAAAHHSVTSSSTSSHMPSATSMSPQPRFTMPEMSPVTKELIGGSLAGIMQVVAGHPLDVLKTVSQVNNTSESSFKLFMDTVKKEKLRGLYRGMTPPLMAAVPLNIIIFSSSSFFKSLICEDPTRPTVKESWLSGLLVGSVLGLPLAPVEVLKCRLAVQANVPGMHQYNGPVDLAKDLYRKHGLRNGLFQGWAACTSREFCLSFYFATNTLAKKLMRGDDVDRKLTPLECAIAGGAAGFAVWTCGYPIDVVKSRIQTSNVEGLPNGRRHHGMLATARSIFQKEGLRGFTRGFTPCLVRGVLVNSAIFFAYDVFKQSVEEDRGSASESV